MHGTADVPRYGLRSMRERAEAIGASLDVADDPVAAPRALVLARRRARATAEADRLPYAEAPALKVAHIGIAMGARGSDVAREAAALVLADDDFPAIVDAVRLGRRIYDNLTKAVRYVCPVHGFHRRHGGSACGLQLADSIDAATHRLSGTRRRSGVLDSF